MRVFQQGHALNSAAVQSKARTHQQRSEDSTITSFAGCRREVDKQLQYPGVPPRDCRMSRPCLGLQLSNVSLNEAMHKRKNDEKQARGERMCAYVKYVCARICMRRRLCV